MRSVGLFALCPRRLLGIILAAALASTGFGCHQHYYYYGDACPPVTAVPSTVRAGAVCDVPTQVVEGGTRVANGSSRSTVVSGAVSSNSSPRVVVSEPSEPAKVAWKRSDPDTNTSTTVQGGLNDSTIDR
jgi:hypothetical protein